MAADYKLIFFGNDDLLVCKNYKLLQNLKQQCKQIISALIFRKTSNKTMMYCNTFRTIGNQMGDNTQYKLFNQKSS